MLRIYTYNIIKHAIIENCHAKIACQEKNLEKQKKVAVMENLQTVTVSQQRQRGIYTSHLSPWLERTDTVQMKGAIKNVHGYC